MDVTRKSARKWIDSLSLRVQQALFAAAAYLILLAICLLATGALSIASLYVTAAAKGTAVSGEDIAQIAVVACFALIFLAVNLPCMFRLGVEKGRLLFMAMIGVIVFFIMGFGDKIADGINKASAGGNLAPGAVAIAALALAANMASVALSGRAYKKKMR